MIGWFRKARGDREALQAVMRGESRLQELALHRMIALRDRAQAVRELRQLLRDGLRADDEQGPPESGIVPRIA